MDRATPIYTRNAVLSTPLAIVRCRTSDEPIPSTKGKLIPAKAMPRTLPPVCRRDLGSNSRPARNRKNIMPRISSKLSLHATAAGCLGAALISAFTYHMIRELNDNDPDVMSLWVVSIFSGLIGLVGILHIATATSRTTDSISFSSRLHPFSIFKYPHTIGALAVKLQIVGFLLSLLTSGIGFYYGNSHWKWGHLVVFSAIQSTATGILHAFGRVLVLDCAPSGKEGVFSIWFAWMRAAGLCVGFTVGSVSPGHIRTSFGAAFCTAMAGIVVLLFGNISDVGGAVAAGHVRDENERSSAVPRLDSKETAHV
ncbi:hypothetical protein SESBI_46655 [Sesbania bispinosa]|nr:hypothetical protein SESBI_46655 [Sesbania bispinosa]